MGSAENWEKFDIQKGYRGEENAIFRACLQKKWFGKKNYPRDGREEEKKR